MDITHVFDKILQVEVRSYTTLVNRALVGCMGTICSFQYCYGCGSTWGNRFSRRILLKQPGGFRRPWSTPNLWFNNCNLFRRLFQSLASYLLSTSRGLSKRALQGFSPLVHSQKGFITLGHSRSLGSQSTPWTTSHNLPGVKERVHILQTTLRTSWNASVCWVYRIKFVDINSKFGKSSKLQISNFKIFQIL